MKKDGYMDLTDLTVPIGMIIAIASVTILLDRLTSLPFWAAALISIPVGYIPGTLIGLILAALLSWAANFFQKPEKPER